VEKLGRAQAETLARSSKMDEACERLQAEKAAAEQGRVSVGSKLAVQERQLRTFLAANEVRCLWSGGGGSGAGRGDGWGVPVGGGWRGWGRLCFCAAILGRIFPAFPM
jgi:hypothetical protein